MKEKFLQIIPTPADMWATFKDGDGETKRERVACLALTEEAGYRSVVAMVYDEEDWFLSAGVCGDNVIIEYSKA